MIESEGETNYKIERERIEKILLRAVRASEHGIGRLVGEQGNWGTYLHARVIMNASSMLGIIDAALRAPKGAQLLDHFSVASVARTAIEAALMMLYITEQGLTPDQWMLRRTVLKLQETCHRHRMFKAAAELDGAPLETIQPMLADYRVRIEELRAEIASNPAFAELEEDIKKRILTGQDAYIGGVRAAVRAAGWSGAAYEHVSAYLSGYIHALPVSFMRADQHGIDLRNISLFNIRSAQ